MIMTTLGSDYWPQAAEGRQLGWLLALFAFAIFGYITATIASYFVRQDAGVGAAPAQPDGAVRDELGAEVLALRQQIEVLLTRESSNNDEQPRR